MKPLALIGHDLWETFGVAPSTLRNAGLDVVMHNARKDDNPPALDDVAAIVVFGGGMNVDSTQEFPFLLAERELVRRAVENGVPFLGICLGAQMLARAQGAAVYRAPVREFGFTAFHPTPEAATDPLVSVFDDGDMVFHWHEDTFDLPSGAVLLGTGDEVETQAFRIGEHAWGLQFHFEPDDREFGLWMDDAGDEMKDGWGKSVEEVREDAARYLGTQQGRAREVFRRFAGIVLGSVDRRARRSAG